MQHGENVIPAQSTPSPTEVPVSTTIQEPKTDPRAVHQGVSGPVDLSGGRTEPASAEPVSASEAPTEDTRTEPAIQETPERPPQTSPDTGEENLVDTPEHIAARIRAQESERYSRMIEERDNEVSRLKEHIRELQAMIETKPDDSDQQNPRQELSKKFGGKLDEDVLTYLSDMESRLLESEKNREAMTLLMYRDRVVKQFNNEVIEEMITGNTVDEIRNSAQKAHEAYKRYVSGPQPTTASMASATTPQVRQADPNSLSDIPPTTAGTVAPPSPPAPPVPAFPQGPGPQARPVPASKLSNLNSMTPSERMKFFSEHRDEIVKEAENEALNLFARDQTPYVRH